MTKPTPDPSPEPTPASPPDAAARVDGPVVARALQKVLAKQELTRDERSALKRHETNREEQLRWQYYGSIPQKHWRAMSGRQTKVLHEQADRYGVPFGGAFINLSAVVKALHDFFADNALKLAKEDDPLMQGGGSPALEAYRGERALLAKLDRLERERQLIPREQSRQSLAKIASILRTAGDTLQRQFGQGAGEILYDALHDCQREVDRTFGDTPHGNDNGDVHADGISQSPDPG